jgi:hypothetical protein
MDLHRRRSVLVRMGEDGRRLGKARITNSPAELVREIADLLAGDRGYEVIQQLPGIGPVLAAVIVALAIRGMISAAQRPSALVRRSAPPVPGTCRQGAVSKSLHMNYIAPPCDLQGPGHAVGTTDIRST